MAVYSKLLLSAGGGIISAKQQAKQEENTATLLIGLGGTGVNCIRTIKTRVYDRLEPDDPTAVMPRYSRIQFLGVDADIRQKGDSKDDSQEVKDSDEILALKKDEFFGIDNKNIGKTFTTISALKKRDELSWLEYEKITLPNLTDRGAGGIRQVGRFMMMDKSQELKATIEEKIIKAKTNMDDPEINVHIFSGLGGGTGSGCFLDVCYMVSDILKNSGNIFGYFFLPDVNLSNIAQKEANIREYIAKNGYAAMQELDYCMRLPSNGGSFTQIYQGGKKIAWDRPPVDMCHLICATDQNNKVISDAYTYAMNVTAEYVMDMLTYSSNWGLHSHLSNFRSHIGETNEKKKIGSEMAYCTIGASCASIPLREINTYLASELFVKFAKTKSRIPKEKDVKEFLFPALVKGAKSDREVYEALLEEIKTGVKEYEMYPDDWKDILDGDGAFTDWYTDQTSYNLGEAETNAASMMSTDNKQSLINRVRSKLADVICDIDKGPFYAYCLLNAAESHSILEIVKGLLEMNRVRWNELAAQGKDVRKAYEDAREDFNNRNQRRLFDNDKKRFEDYEDSLRRHEEYKVFLGPKMDDILDDDVTGIYEKMDTVLKNFEEQLMVEGTSYYKKLRDVMDTLVGTFIANKNDLAGERMKSAGNSFNTPLVTISELKDTLDRQISNLNIQGLFDQFMHLLLKNEDTWITENENKISRLVTDFFVNHAFSDFAGHTITEYLQDKYNTQNTGQLTNYISKEIDKLTDKAKPLFYFNGSIWPETETTKVAFISYPNTSGPISQAAQDKVTDDKSWNLKQSALTDRIFVLSSACGFPLSAYNNCAEYEKLYYNSKTSGRHYYEGKPVKGMEFTDWNKLSPITPQSLIELEDDEATDRAYLVREARILFEKAKKFGVIDGGGGICKLDETDMAELRTICDKCEKRILLAREKKETEELIKRLESLLPIKLESTKYTLPTDGLRTSTEEIKRIQKDYFVASPVLHPIVNQYTESVENMTNKIESLIKEIREKENARNIREGNMKNYCNALFTGIIKITGNLVIYEGGRFGSDIYELSKMGEDFPYDDIAVYQGFASYCELEDDVKNEITEKTNHILNFQGDEAIAYVPTIKKELSEKHIKLWGKSAQRKENYDEINRFLSDMVDRFELHCRRYDEQED